MLICVNVAIAFFPKTPPPSGIAAKYPNTHANDVSICGKRCVSKKIVCVNLFAASS